MNSIIQLNSIQFDNFDSFIISSIDHVCQIKFLAVTCLIYVANLANFALLVQSHPCIPYNSFHCIFEIIMYFCTKN